MQKPDDNKGSCGATHDELADRYEALAQDYEDAPRDVDGAMYAARLREAAAALRSSSCSETTENNGGLRGDCASLGVTTQAETKGRDSSSSADPHQTDEKGRPMTYWGGVAHSKTEYKRLKEQGADVLPPADKWDQAAAELQGGLAHKARNPQNDWCTGCGPHRCEVPCARRVPSAETATLYKCSRCGASAAEYRRVGCNAIPCPMRSSAQSAERVGGLATQIESVADRIYDHDAEASRALSAIAAEVAQLELSARSAADAVTNFSLAPAGKYTVTAWSEPPWNGREWYASAAPAAPVATLTRYICNGRNGLDPHPQGHWVAFQDVEKLLPSASALKMPRTDEILLACGEMKAPELRTVLAVLRWFIDKANATDSNPRHE